jgi:tetratricopeptide (TPR) repeat protein
MPMYLTKKAVYAALVWLLIICFISPSMAQVVDCHDELAQAEESYKKGRFEEAITLLESCLEKQGLPQSDRRKAYRLLGLTYLAQDYRDQAKQAVTQLLRLVPDYISDPNQDPPPFSRMVDEIRREIHSEPTVPLSTPIVEKSGKKKWILIGLGILATGVGITLLLSGGGESETPPPTIADPPALP